METVYGKEIESPLGRLYIGSISGKLCYVHFSDKNGGREHFERWLKKWAPAYVFADGHCSCLMETEKQINAYFRRERTTFDVPLRLFGTTFQQSVWEELQMIPFGKTSTYSQIAQMIDNPKAVRAVGGANNRNPISIIVPCHRVIGADGQLVGYGGGLNRKEMLLSHEKKVTS